MDKNAVTDSDSAPTKSAPLRRGCLGYLLPFFTFNIDSGLTRKPPRFGCLIPAIIICLLAIAPGYIGWLKLKEIQTQMIMGSDASQIQRLIISWAAEHNQQLPDSGLGFPVTANQVFRRLFQDGITTSESCFGGQYSPYVPDNHIGAAPDYVQAVAKGENHWMIVAGQNLTHRPGSAPTPLFFENALAPTWPPIWQETWLPNSNRGRTLDGKILVAYADGSVHWVKLVKTPQGLTLPESAYPAEWKIHPPRILDVEDIQK